MTMTMTMARHGAESCVFARQGAIMPPWFFWNEFQALGIVSARVNHANDFNHVQPWTNPIKQSDVARYEKLQYLAFIPAMPQIRILFQ